MQEYRTEDGQPVIVRGRHLGGILVLLFMLGMIVAVILFATGVFSARVTRQGTMPNVSVQGGALPSAEIRARPVEAGTHKQTIDVPAVRTRKQTVDVPDIGAK